MKLTSLLLYSALALLPHPAVASDTLDELLTRIRVSQTQQFHYRETRHMQLMAEPWQASGELFISPQQMVIVQLAPTDVITVITADQMQHRDRAKGINRNIQLERPFAVPGMEPFMQLLYRSEENNTLQQDYTITHASDADHWSLQLQPRQHTRQDISRMQLSGYPGHGPDYLVLIHEDGDRTEWQLSLQSQGETAQHALQQRLTTSR